MFQAGPAAPDVEAPEVLVVDRDALHAGLLADLLAGAGFRPEAAATAGEALAMARLWRFAAILLSLSPPEAGGPELFRGIPACGANRDTPVIVVCSGYLAHGNR